MKKTSDDILAHALELIAKDIETEDGVVEGALFEAAMRLREYNRLLLNIKLTLNNLLPEDTNN